MEKRLILAITLSMMVFIFFYSYQSQYFIPTELPQTAENQNTIEPEKPKQTKAELLTPKSFETMSYLEEGFWEVIFDSHGDIKDIEILKYKNADGSTVPMLLADNIASQGIKFDFYFENMYFARKTGTAPNVYHFYSEVRDEFGNEYIYNKIYTFQKDEFMFSVNIKIDSKDISKAIPFEKDSNIYELYVGPQIGPDFKILDMRNEYRYYKYFTNNKIKTTSLGFNTSRDINFDYQWFSFVGRYFSMIVDPSFTNPDTTISTFDFTDPAGNIKSGSQFSVRKPNSGDSRENDLFYFYLGPNLKGELAKYNRADKNNFQVASMNFDKIVSDNMLSFLEYGLKYIMNFFYILIPNWGVSILFLTLLVKVAMLPLHIKSVESNAALKKVAPKMEAIKLKYKDDPTKMNLEISNLYRTEGVNPLGGCLPLLIQMPFLFAMYGMFSDHFDLRGATFIPGWIDDLSSPESILSFGFAIPILGWTELRLLPILYLATQITSSLILQRQNPIKPTKGMNMMTYGMQIFFFFMLYDMPSGLLVYWIFSNILSVLQSLVFTPDFVIKRQEAEAKKNPPKPEIKQIRKPDVKKKR